MVPITNHVMKVLAMDPVRPGVGRAAQEMLSAVTGIPIEQKPTEIVRRPLKPGHEGCGK